jgi:hypothetical protein
MIKQISIIIISCIATVTIAIMFHNIALEAVIALEELGNYD